MYCGQLDKAFRDAEQQISDSITEKKMRLGVNAFWGRIPDNGGFPLNSGTRIKKIRLSRIGFGQMETGWRTVVDNGCNSNVCSDPPADTLTHGSDEFFYGLEVFRVATDPICLSLIPFRQIGAKELMHFENEIRKIAQYFWDEWCRSRYLNLCENKWVCLVSDAAVTGDTDICNTLERQCTPMIEDHNGWIFWNRGPLGTPVLDPNYSMDERYVSVNVPLAKVKNISELSGDIVETACLNLQDEDENMPFADQGIPLLDLVVPDVRVQRRLIQLERLQESECLPLVTYDGKSLSLSLGIKRVIRDLFGIRWDHFGMKFYPDDVYNTTLATYDPNNPSTWPRFKRIFSHVPARNPNGTVKYVSNGYYRTAPFGISALYTPAVMGMRSHPEAQSIGSATVGPGKKDYTGELKWINKYDKVCNPNEDIGYWQLNFGAGAEPDRPENGHAFFHRIDHSISLSGVRCAIPIMGCGVGGMTSDCYDSVQADELGITAGVSRGANTVSTVNNARFFI